MVIPILSAYNTVLISTPSEISEKHRSQRSKIYPITQFVAPCALWVLMQYFRDFI